MNVEWVPDALHDVDSAVSYYEERSERAPTQFADELAAALIFILERPQRLALRKGGYRRKNLKKFPYHIPYVIRQDTVWILAVAHDRREPEFWLTRQSQIPR
ncbi:MAG TPA: type II toxin-antitoxin system RelE/ParE family toxin [Chthoniobacteraceae bacterium]|nr:type II toxin-antitoxin system RelE/ParE family toxin [Chthoniobacteraceae bacterium]